MQETGYRYRIQDARNWFKKYDTVYRIRIKVIRYKAPEYRIPNI